MMLNTLLIIDLLFLKQIKWDRFIVFTFNCIYLIFRHFLPYTKWIYLTFLMLRKIIYPVILVLISITVQI
ncbi:hypothetical protein AFL46_18170 [Providencia stuartii]|nr:hypothetical protein AFL46_18170 [Providencia stuartii]